MPYADPEKARACSRASKERRRRKLGVPVKVKLSPEERKARRKQVYQKHYAANKERIQAKQVAYRQANRTQLRELFMVRTYGLTLEQLDQMLMAQGMKCAICERPLEKYHVDHDHACCNVKSPKRTCGNCIRGLLCAGCNGLLGRFEDQGWRDRAEAYIQEHRRKPS